MKRLINLLTIVFLVPFSLHAQDLSDALRYSNFQVQGTARAAAMGNAFGALGGDFTSVSINPAGLGVYRAGELTFTPTFGQTEVEASYFGNTMSDKLYKFTLNNLSYVAAIETQNTSESGMVNFNIGIGYNRLKDFNSEMIIGANGVESSFLDFIASYANEYEFDPESNQNDPGADFYEWLAWETYLLNPDDNFQKPWRHVLEKNNSRDGYGQYQRKSISKQGSIDEYSLSFGMNFNHKLYLGASLGITDVYYKESSRILEEDRNGNIPGFNKMEFDSYLRTTGTGYNGKLGIIFKPIQQIRLGASIHTPTFYTLNEIRETSMFSDITNEEGNNTYEALSPYGEYDYNLVTPMRGTFSGAFVIAKKGLISVDYEIVDYSSANLRRASDGYDYVDENQEIVQSYRFVGNLRLGGELRVTNEISLRAGFENYPSAFNSDRFNVDPNLYVYTSGLGYRSGGIFFDVAFRYATGDSFDLLHPDPITDDYPLPQMAQINTASSKLLFTLGFKF